MCNKCFQGLMCVDEQAQYQKHLLAFSSKFSSSPSSSSARGRGRGGRGRSGGVVFSNGVVIHRQEGLLPSKPVNEEQQQKQEEKAATATATATIAATTPVVPSASVVLPL
jgi:hypothetical protein